MKRRTVSLRCWASCYSGSLYCFNQSLFCFLSE